MTDTTQHRRAKACILYADVFGYTRSTLQDEVNAYSQWRENLNIFRHAAKTFGGYVAQDQADSVVLVINEPMDAVKCALDIQSRLDARNKVQHERARLIYRIGVCYGEVYFLGDDIFGHTINHAARIQALCRPGGITINNDLYAIASGRLNVFFSRHGEYALKHIPDVETVWHVESPTLNPQAAALKAATFHSVVVIVPTKPRDNDQYSSRFSEFLTEALFDTLSRFNELSVLKGERNLTPDPTVTQSQRIDFYFESYAHITPKGFEIMVMLVKDEFPVWTEQFTYDVELNHSQILVYKICLHTIDHLLQLYEASYMRGRFGDSGYDLLIGAQVEMNQLSPNANDKAKRMLERALRNDNTFARGFSALSRVYHNEWRYDWTDDGEAAQRKSLELAQSAVTLDENDAKTHAELSFAHLFMQNAEQAQRASDRAFMLNQADTEVLIHRADLFYYKGDAEEAVAIINHALQISDRDTDTKLWALGGALFTLKRYEETIRTLEKMSDPEQSHRLLAACYALVGETEIAQKHADAVLTSDPNFSTNRWITLQPDIDKEELLHFYEGLRKAGLPD